MANEALKRICDGDLSQVNSEEIKNQLYMYMLEHARASLSSNIRLIDALNMLENKYIEKSIEYIAENDDETAIEYLPKMIEVISKCLADSNRSIETVVNNKEIQSLMIVNQDNRQINIGDGGDDVKTAIEDPVSREKIREAVGKIFKYINEESEKVESSFIEVTDTNNNGD